MPGNQNREGEGEGEGDWVYRESCRQTVSYCVVQGGFFGVVAGAILGQTVGPVVATTAAAAAQTTVAKDYANEKGRPGTYQFGDFTNGTLSQMGKAINDGGDAIRAYMGCPRED